MFVFIPSGVVSAFQGSFIDNKNSKKPWAVSLEEQSPTNSMFVPERLLSDTFMRQVATKIPTPTVGMRAGWMSTIHLSSDMQHPILAGLTAGQQRVMQQLLDGIHKAADPCWRLDPIQATYNPYGLKQVAPMVGFTQIPLNFMQECLQTHPDGRLQSLAKRIQAEGGVALHHFLTFEPNANVAKTQGNFHINSVLSQWLHTAEARTAFTQYLLNNWVREANKPVSTFEQRYDTLNFGGKDVTTTIFFWRNKFVQDAQAILEKPSEQRTVEDLLKVWIKISMLRHTGMDLGLPNHTINPTDLNTAFFTQRFGGNVAMGNNHSILEMDEACKQLTASPVRLIDGPQPLLERAAIAPATMPALLTQIAPQVYESFLGLLPWSHYWWENLINTQANKIDNTLIPLPLPTVASVANKLTQWAEALRKRHAEFAQQLTSSTVENKPVLPDLEAQVVSDNLPKIQQDFLRGHGMANQIEAAAWALLPVEQRTAFYTALTELTHHYLKTTPDSLIALVQKFNAVKPYSTEYADFLMQTVSGKPVMFDTLP